MRQFEARDVRVVAISVDSPEATENLRKKEGYTFLFLCDTKAEVIRRWDLLHPHAGIEGGDIARPAEFLIDPVGTIRWVNLTEDFRKRVHAPAVLKVMDDLHVGAPASP